MMKKFVAIFLVMSMLLGGVALAADEPLRVAWWGSESSNALYLGEADLFTKATGIEYEAEYLSWGDYWTKINTLAAANDLPDTLRMDYQYILNYVDKDQLMDLTPLVESGAIDLSKVPDSAISGGRFGKGLYGINAGSNGLTMAVNAKLVQDAGMEVLANDATWEDFEAWAIEFHEKTGLYGADLFGAKDYNGVFRIFARSHGEELYNEAQDGAGFKAETLAAFFASIKRMQDAGATQNIADAVTDIGKENYPFSKGEAATIFTVTDSYTTYAAVLKDRFGEVPMRLIPGAAATKAMFVKPSQFLSIAATAEKVDEAAKFINYWVNDEEANLFIAGRRGEFDLMNIGVWSDGNLTSRPIVYYYGPDGNMYLQEQSFREILKTVLFGIRSPLDFPADVQRTATIDIQKVLYPRVCVDSVFVIDEEINETEVKRWKFTFKVRSYRYDVAPQCTNPETVWMIDKANNKILLKELNRHQAALFDAKQEAMSGMIAMGTDMVVNLLGDHTPESDIYRDLIEKHAQGIRRRAEEDEDD